LENFTPALQGTEPGITPLHLKEFEHDMLLKLNQPNPQAVVISKFANAWLDEASTMPIPQMLFGELWYESELCVLFADSNTGKSLLAVQIANSICTGKPINGFKLTAQPQPVMYVDFELNTKQFQSRYSDNYDSNFQFSENLIRTVINSQGPLLDGSELEEALKDSIMTEIMKYNVKVLIVDNLTYLTSEAEKSKEASGLMKFLKRLKEDLNLSILVLAHTPKRDETRPITANDCQGSKMLGNFSDSSFTIGKSNRDKSLRYIKQIKVRIGAMTYNADNVITCRIGKQHNFTEFEFVDYCRESQHLKQNTEEVRQQNETRIFELHSDGLSLRQIAEQMNISHMTVKRIIEKRNNT
jgi:RecA-family ATPase